MAIEYAMVLKSVIEGNDLTQDQAYEAFCEIMGGELSEIRISALLAGLATKGHSVSEITGAAMAMREKATRIDVSGCEGVIDIVGTGGTGISTFNVSTASCFVAAGAGAKVAKHGNITNTRASGAANALVALGVNIDVGPEVVARCVREAGIGFCFARNCHPAMKNVVGVRKELPVRTIFNILGPLTNPAGAKNFLMGVFSQQWAERLAEVLGRLGARNAWVVSGGDGTDEISVTGPTTVTRLRNGALDTFTLSPEEYNIPLASLADISVDSPEESAEVIHAILDGEKGPARDIVLLNSAAALVISGVSDEMHSAINVAAESIDSGAAGAALEKLVELTQE